MSLYVANSILMNKFMIAEKRFNSLFSFNVHNSMYIYIAALILLSMSAGVDVVYSKGVLSIGLMGLAICVLLIRRFPELPFMLLAVGMSFWDLLGRVVPLAGLALLLTLGLIAVVVAITAFSDKATAYRFKFNSVDVYLVLFTLWAWLSLFWSPNIAYGSFKLQGFTAYSVISYFFVRIYFSSLAFSFTRVAAFMVAAGFGHALLALYAAFITGLYNPNVLGMRYYLIRQVWNRGSIGEAEALALGLIGTTILFGIHRQRYRYVLGALFAFQLWAFMGYQQRSATISLVIGLFAYFILSSSSQDRPNRNKLLRGFIGFVSLVGLAVLFLQYNPQLALTYLVQDNNVLDRLSYFALGWQTFVENPLFGIGAGGMGSLLGDIIDDFYVHNRILEIGAELGTVGLVLATLLTISLAKYVKFIYSAENLHHTVRHLGALASACLIIRYVVGMSSGDLVAWKLGIWAGILVASVELAQRSWMQEIDLKQTILIQKGRMQETDLQQQTDNSPASF